jgi:hypothetical protein
MNNVPSKYIKRLRILTDEMCNTNDKILLKELKQIIELSQSEISKKITLKSKLKNYELLCITITKLLQTLD